jgi:hypothetical protein
MVCVCRIDVVTKVVFYHLTRVHEKQGGMCCISKMAGGLRQEGGEPGAGCTTEGKVRGLHGYQKQGRREWRRNAWRFACRAWQRSQRHAEEAGLESAVTAWHAYDDRASGSHATEAVYLGQMVRLRMTVEARAKEGISPLGRLSREPGYEGMSRWCVGKRGK